MKINVHASLEAVLATGPYQNMRPSFSAGVEMEIDPKVPIDAAVKGMQDRLYEVCKQKMYECEQKAIADRIQKERSGFRFYYNDKGEPYPSVTSILGVDKDFFVDEEQLRLLAFEGTIRHALAAEYIKTGKMPEARDLEEYGLEYLVLKKAGLSVNGNGFLNFLEKYPLTQIENGAAVLSDEHKYGGTPDLWCVPKANPKEDIIAAPTIADIKRTANPHENFMQMAAYIKASGRDIKQMMVIVLNDKTQQQYSKPIVSQAVEKYFAMFLKKRADFKKRYGI